MASQTQSQSLLSSESTARDDLDSQSLSQSLSQSQIPVRCGSVEGHLHLDKYSGSLAGREGNNKCIYCNSKSKWVSPIEFESLGGKARSGKWKQSIKTTNNISIGTFLSKPGSTCLLSPRASPSSQPCGVSQASTPSLLRRPTSSSPLSQSPATSHDAAAFNPPASSKLTNPLLAFIKAYRLRGDASGLRTAVLSAVDPVRLLDAYKALWQHCKTDLEELGISFKSRRDSDKRSVSEAVLGDIVVAFEVLDNANKLPFIFLEANDLLSIPPVILDPIAKKLSENTSSIECLSSAVSQLSSTFQSLPTADVYVSAIDKLTSDIQTQFKTISESINTISSTVNASSSSVAATSSQHHNSVSQKATVASGSKQSRKTPSRSNRIILFNLPETSLMDTKVAIDDISEYLIGKKVNICNAIRLR